MMDRSKSAPGYDVWGIGDDEFWAAHEAHGDGLGTFATEVEAIAATWAAYDREHADAIADFAERAAAQLAVADDHHSPERNGHRWAISRWLVAFAKGGA